MDGPIWPAHRDLAREGVQAPRWLQFALKMHLVNEAAAPLPGQIRPHTATWRSKTVCGGVYAAVLFYLTKRLCWRAWVDNDGVHLIVNE